MNKLLYASTKLKIIKIVVHEPLFNIELLNKYVLLVNMKRKDDHFRKIKLRNSFNIKYFNYQRRAM